MRQGRTTFSQLVLRGLMLFPILTIIQGISVFEQVNKVWLAVVSLALLGRILNDRYSVKQFLVLLLTAVLHVVALLYTDFPLHNVNMLFYFLLWVLMYLFFSKNRQRILGYMGKSTGFIQLIVWIWTLVVGVSILLPSSYSNGYFVSFAGSSFRSMPSALAIMALIMYLTVKTGNGKFDLLLLMPLYTTVTGRSRTYFAVVVLFLMMYLYIRLRTPKKFFLAMLPFLLMVLVLAMSGGMAEKLEEIRFAMKYSDNFWSVFTNQRTDFWRWDLEAFFDLPVLQQLVGNGFNFAFDVTGKYYGTGIWAHNDIINILMNFGYIGVGIYLWIYIRLVRAYMPRGSRIPRMVRFLFHCAVWFNSMLNMSYTYLCATIAYPLFLCLIAEAYRVPAASATCLNAEDR